MNPDPARLQRFGRCSLDVEKKVLWCDDEPVSLPLKAVELLSLLVEKRGEVVTKDEIWQAVWQDAFVEETNLTHNIYVLRKALKDLGEPELIQTVPRRGYRFAGEVMGPSNGDIVIEKHSISRTLIEELSPQAALSVRERPYSRGLVLSLGILAILIAGGFSFWKYSRTESTAAAGTIRSIAVLPLVSASEAPDDGALSFGFTDALLTSLGNLEEVRVVSARQGRTERLDAAQLGQALAVDSVLEGTLQRANGKLRVTLRLVRSADGAQIWTGSFDESESEIFRLQDAMALQTARALSREVRLDKHATENRDAYNAYILGRFFFDKRDSENYRKAIDEFTRAIALDPKYALAYAGLADVYAMQANIRGGAERDELYERSRSMALKALAIDEASAEAHTSLAWIKRVRDWDWEGSEREFRRAIELDPNYANARQWYSFLLLSLGRMDEALAQMEKARELEPLSRIILNNSITVRNYRGEIELLLPIAEQVTRMDNSEPGSSWILSLAYSRTGQHLKVVEVGETYMAQNGGNIASDYLASNLAIAYARTGRDSKAAAILAHLKDRAKKDNEAAFRLAQAYADLERKDEAIALLQSCLKAHDDRMVWLKTEPRFVSLRSDPRFVAMLREMRLDL